MQKRLTCGGLSKIVRDMEDKKSIVIYLDYKEVFELLTPEQCKELILAILSYDGSTPELSPMVRLASIPIFNQMNRDRMKWEDIKRKRAEAGRKGGKKTQFQANQAIASSGETSKSSKRVANQAVNVNVNGNVTDNVTDNVINNKKEKIYKKESPRLDHVLQDIIDFYNLEYGTRFELKPVQKNLEYWLGMYSEQQVKIAIKLLKIDPWWSKVHTPVKLFRTRNANGECDNIGDLLNKYRGKYELN